MTQNGLPALEKWLSRVAPTTARVYKFYIMEWLKWLQENGGAFSALTPDELISYQKGTNKESEWELLELVQQWLLTLKDMRSSTKRNALKAVRSFFTHNRVSLPADRSFHLKGDLGIVPNNLTVQEIRQVVLASNKAMRATFMIMLMGGMDQSSFQWWSDNCWNDLQKQLKAEEDIIKVVIPGRKGSLNEVEFSTYIFGDALYYLKDYLKDRGNAPGAIILNQFDRPITKIALADYWTRTLQSLGITSRTGILTERYGRGIHNLRDTFRTQWAVSGAAAPIGESMMGHQIDPLNYNQSPKNEDYVHKQLRIAAPYLSILTRSEPFGMIRTDELLAVKKELQELKSGKSGEVADLRAEMLQMRKDMSEFLKAGGNPAIAVRAIDLLTDPGVPGAITVREATSFIEVSEDEPTPPKKKADAE